MTTDSAVTFEYTSISQQLFDTSMTVADLTGTAHALLSAYIPDIYSKKDRVRLAGNAVTPPVMAWIVGRVTRALEEAAS